MEENLKQLLLKDLSARLPYGVVVSCKIIDFNIEEPSKDSYPNHTRHPEYTGNGILFLVDCLANRVQIRPILTGLDYKEQVYFEQMCNCGYIAIEDCKPYLRPMSSMTEEEREEYLHINLCDVIDCEAWNEVDWLNAHHFDYRGLIENGLATEAPKGMYN